MPHLGSHIENDLANRRHGIARVEAEEPPVLRTRLRERTGRYERTA